MRRSARPCASKAAFATAPGRVEGGEQEPTLDGSGTLRGVALPFRVAPERMRAWGVVTLAYLAGLADGALTQAIEHARNREQFGAALGALPAVQARLADAAVIRDGVTLCAWAAADPESDFAVHELAWAGGACRKVTAHALQVHGAVGFALESGVHRFYRRAKTVQVWTDAVLRSRFGATAGE
jgi:alkylation response protein AidB-like acyl-CoA dehydrogenase